MSEEAKPTHFGLIRHAETLWNQESRIQGHQDSQLTDRGKRDAAGWGRRLRQVSWDRMIGSDLGRAVETARIINQYLQIPFETDQRLREQDWGDWTAEAVAKIISEELPKLVESKRSGWQFCPPGGEDRLRVWERSRSALMDIAEHRSGETILIVTHEGVIKSLIYRLSNHTFSPGEPALLEPRSLHWLTASRSQLQIQQLNALELA